MISIANPAGRLQAFCGSAVTTDVKFTVGFFNTLAQSSSDDPKQLRTTIRTVSNGVTDVQISPYAGQTVIDAAITSGVSNQVQNIYYIKAYNSNASSVTVTIQIEDGNDDIQQKATLGTLESLYYEDGRGWYSTDANGAIKSSISQIPLAPLFLAYNGANDDNVTGAGTVATVDFDTEVFDVTGNFATDTFTAPITGKYLLTAQVRVLDLTAAMTQRVYAIVTSNRSYTAVNLSTPDAAGQETISISAIADMDAADTAVVRCTISNGAGDTADIFGTSSPSTFFSGVRVG